MAHQTTDDLRPDELLRHPPDFSLVLGGPLFQLLRRTHLADDALMMVRQRIVVIALFAWLPLLALVGRSKGKLLGGERGGAVPAGRGGPHPLPGGDARC